MNEEDKIIILKEVHGMRNDLRIRKAIDLAYQKGRDSVEQSSTNLEDSHPLGDERKHLADFMNLSTGEGKV